MHGGKTKQETAKIERTGHLDRAEPAAEWQFRRADVDRQPHALEKSVHLGIAGAERLIEREPQTLSGSERAGELARSLGRDEVCRPAMLLSH